MLVATAIDAKTEKKVPGRAAAAAEAQPAAVAAERLVGIAGRRAGRQGTRSANWPRRWRRPRSPPSPSSPRGRCSRPSSASKVDWFGLMPMFALTVLLSWAVLVPSKIRERRKGGAGHLDDDVRRGRGRSRRVLARRVGAADDRPRRVAAAADRVVPRRGRSRHAGDDRAPGRLHGVLRAVALAMTTWSDHTRRRRKERFSLGRCSSPGWSPSCCGSAGTSSSTLRSAGLHAGGPGRHGRSRANGQPVDAAAAAATETPATGICVTPTRGIPTHKAKGLSP